MSNLVPTCFDIWGLGLELVFSILFSMMSVQQMIEATNQVNLQTTKSPLMTHLDENVSKACHDQGKLHVVRDHMNVLTFRISSLWRD